MLVIYQIRASKTVYGLPVITYTEKVCGEAYFAVLEDFITNMRRSKI